MKENERYLEYFQIPLIFCCRTPYGSYPMSVVFILSYWKLPFGVVFLLARWDSKGRKENVSVARF